MTARDELTSWVRSMDRPDATLLAPDGCQFAVLDPQLSRRAAVLVLFGERAAEDPTGDRAHGAPDDAPLDTPLGAPANRSVDIPRQNIADGTSNSGPGHADLDLLFVMRASTLSNHPGQVAFPGGGIDAGDADEAGAALREAREETGLDPKGVDVLGSLPEVGLPVSNFMVTPVLGWWREQSAVHAVDAAESESVFRCPVSTLLAPGNRRTAVLRRNGFVSRTPAFVTPHAIIWGFTAMLLDSMFEGLGWTQRWDRSQEIPAPL